MSYNLQLTPHSKAFFEKLIVTQLVKKLLAFYGTWRFITVLITACHWPLSWARWIQFKPSQPISLWSILTLSSHLCLVSQVVSSFRIS